ncbi:MAG: hypothetical protein ACKOB4_16785 [Acidobacteriota bacterium]
MSKSRRPTIRSILALFLLFCGVGLPAAPVLSMAPESVGGTQGPPAKSPATLPPDRSKHALIIAGISGEESYATIFNAWRERLQRALVERLGFAPEQIVVLAEKPLPGERRSTAAVIGEALGELQRQARPGQQIFIFMIGHGSFDGETARFNLPGPDLTAREFADLVRPLTAERLVIINMTSASGEYLKLLNGPGRVVVTATRSGMEQNAPKFAEHFITALEKADADLDRNRRLSILEAFEYATKQTAAVYEKSGKLTAEHALLDDNGDGVGHPQAEAGDGGLARITYLDSLPKQQAGGDPALAQLFEERLRLEGSIEQLKARKSQTPPEEYASSLEKLLLELAKLNRTIRARQKR